MPKSRFKRKYKNRKTKKTRTPKKTRKNRSKKGTNMRGGQEQVKCSMCEKNVNKSDTLVPTICQSKYGPQAAHRICQDCWWDPNTGFAVENRSHKCPGCQKGLPLTTVKIGEPIEIDLSDD